MKANTFFLGVSIALICSIGFSENEILWDFGVVIRKSELQPANNEILDKFPSKYKNSQTKINAVIADPFIPPTINRNTSIISRKVISEPIDLNIHQIKTTAEKSYLMKNYPHVIAILYQRDLSILSEKDQNDLIYLLADAYYQNGNYTEAKTQALSLLKHNRSDKLYILLAMIYESLGENKNAKDNYQKIIAYYPNSDYFNSAKIKSRILVNH
ncbi:MAG: tetratricopeptide repeat protein [Candidatus Marinimicrobia bacterium]|nr:tetratricopeptide repeat protein [Candidatus Neomarinimicrobiota bacterium]